MITDGFEAPTTSGSDAEPPSAAPPAGVRREAFARGRQLAEIRRRAGVTQVALAAAMGVSQARVSKIEHGEVVGIDVVDAYVTALGGTMDIVVRFGDRAWTMA